MPVYEYSEIANRPNIETIDSEGILVSGIKFDVLASAMADKSYEFGTWHEDSQLLKLTFTNTLSTEDEAILDDIVADNS